MEAHQKYCHEMLRRFFLKWSPLGLYTSLVFLDPHNPQFWLYFLRGSAQVDFRSGRESNLDFSRNEVVVEVEDDSAPALIQEAGPSATSSAATSAPQTFEDVSVDERRVIIIDDEPLELAPSAEDLSVLSGGTSAEMDHVSPSGQQGGSWLEEQLLNRIVGVVERVAQQTAERTARALLDERDRSRSSTRRERDGRHDRDERRGRDGHREDRDNRRGRGQRDQDRRGGSTHGRLGPRPKRD